MTRIIAGTARGRKIAVPSEGTRPTSDRAREGCLVPSRRGSGSRMRSCWIYLPVLALLAWKRLPAVPQRSRWWTITRAR